MRSCLVLHAFCGVAAVVLGPTLTLWNFWWASLFQGLLMGQVCLLGMWLAFTQGRTYLRFCGAIGGTAAVWGTSVGASRELWSVAPAQGPDFVFVHVFILGAVVVVAVAVVVVICIGMQRWLMRLARLGVDVPLNYEAEVQFSVRHILAVTAFYAVMLAVGRGLAASPDEPDLWQIVVVGACVAMSVVAVPVATTWAALGHRRPVLRMTAAMLAIGLNSLAIPILIGGPWFQYVGFLAMHLTAAMTVFLSLLVVRSEGYRVVSAQGIRS